MKDTNIDLLLQRGIEAARIKRRATARGLLLQVLEADERNELAWLWLSGVMDDVADQRICLENVLEINPLNAQAKRGLEMLDTKQFDREQSVGSVAIGPAPMSGTTTPGMPASEPPVRFVPAAEPENPCPYCGAPTKIEQRNCIACKNSLMIRVSGGKGLRGMFGVGEWQRFVPTFEDRDHVGHYNTGISYKNKGMWYLAAKEWEAAIKKVPRDPNYRHALGLAYAQLKEFPRAIQELREALAIAPNDARIKESLALVEQKARKER